VQPPPTALPKQPKADTTVKIKKQIRRPQVWERIKSKLFPSQQGVSDPRQKAMVVLIPVLFVVLIFVFVRVFRGPSLKTANAQSSGGPTNIVVDSDNEIDWQMPEPYPTTLRDPMQFVSAAATTGGSGALIVKGILYSRDEPSAVVSGQVVYEGDEILGATVVKINESSVEFEMNGKKWMQKVQALEEEMNENFNH
jgi:hypothetical protein